MIITNDAARDRTRYWVKRFSVALRQVGPDDGTEIRRLVRASLIGVRQDLLDQLAAYDQKVGS